MSDEFQSIPEQGYFLQPGSVSSSCEWHHSLGGHRINFLVCPNCETVLLPLAYLDPTDSRLEISDFPGSILPLVVCRRCFSLRLNYTMNGRGNILVERHESEYLQQPDNVGVIRATDSRPVQLMAIPDRIVTTRRLAREGRVSEAESWAERFDWTEPQNQVGGVPILLRPELRSPVCSNCENEMPFLASIVAVLDLPEEIEGRVLQVLYFFCRGCVNISAISDVRTSDYS